MSYGLLFVMFTVRNIPGQFFNFLMIFQERKGIAFKTCHPESGSRRLGLVIQSGDFGESRINTIVVAVLTFNLRFKAAPGSVFPAKRSTNLPKDSVAVVSLSVTLHS